MKKSQITVLWNLVKKRIACLDSSQRIDWLLIHTKFKGEPSLTVILKRGNLRARANSNCIDVEVPAWNLHKLWKSFPNFYKLKHQILALNLICFDAESGSKDEEIESFKLNNKSHAPKSSNPNKNNWTLLADFKVQEWNFIVFCEKNST